LTLTEEHQHLRHLLGQPSVRFYSYSTLAIFE
jgi:hypothetical protein